MKTRRLFQLAATFRATLIGTALFGLLLYLDLKYNWDLSEQIIRLVHRIEKWEIDEIVICATAILIGLAIDIIVLLNQMQERRRLHAARIEVMEKALLKTQHIVNNYLNEMLIFKIELEKHEHMPKAEIERFGAAIYRAAEELEKIENLEDLYIEIRPNRTARAKPHPHQPEPAANRP